MYKILETKEVLTTIVEEKDCTLAQYIGYKLQQRRKELEWTMSELSLKTLVPGEAKPRVSTTTISNVEAGTSNISLYILESLCEVMVLHISEIFPEKEVLVKAERNWSI